MREKNESENQNNKDCIRKYQINRAKEYLEKHESNGSSESSIECCIISDLLKMLKNKKGE